MDLSGNAIDDPVEREGIMNEIRVGKVSSINYAAGTVRVVYQDKSEKGTAELPVFCGMGEYQMPKIDDQVLVLHLSNDSSIGIVMGGFWSNKKSPMQSGPGTYQKKFNDEGTAFIQLLAGNNLTIRADEVVLQGTAGTITISDLLAMKRKIDAL